MALKVGELEADVTLNDSKFEKGLSGSQRKFAQTAKALAQEAEKGGTKAGIALGNGLGDGAGKGGDKLGRFATSMTQAAEKAGDKAGNALASGIHHGLDKSRGDFKKFNADVGKGATKGGADAGKGLTSGVGDALGGLKALPALAAGTAIGVAVMSGFTQAMDNEDANHLLAAQLGFTEQQSAKSGKIAGDLYKNAFGDSVSDVDQVLKEVFQNGLAKVGDSADAIKGVTTQVMNFSKISKEEALPVTRAISQMLKTGLAKNATEAFDLLTRGVQLGVNKSGDLLDTFNEYGTQFRSIGLNGPMALGLMSQALKAGARDSDVAADSLKEFSIRAVDGSKTTVDGFKSLKLNAKQMQEQIAAGGPKAAAGLGLVLDALRNVKDPAEQARIAVELFGTQSEDMKKALLGMDTSTAVASLGNLKGAAKDAGDTLNDTTSGGLKSVGRTIKMSIVDAISKYALPQLKDFAAWFNGPGKFVLVSWALDAAGAFIGFADKMLGALSGMLGGLSKYAKVALIAAAGSVAMFNPGMAFNMLKQADALGKWADEAKTGIGNARTELQGWKAGLDKTNLKVKFQATTADLDQKIAAAKKALKAPHLTATKTAALKARIDQLLAAKKKAQDAIDAIHGKTVSVVMQYSSTGVNLTAPSSVGRRALGGPVRKGTPYVVGENNPELFVPDQDGTIVPKVPSSASGSAYGGSTGSTVNVVLEFAGGNSGEIERAFMHMVRDHVRARGGSVQQALGAGRG